MKVIIWFCLEYMIVENNQWFTEVKNNIVVMNTRIASVSHDKRDSFVTPASKHMANLGVLLDRFQKDY